MLILVPVLLSLSSVTYGRAIYGEDNRHDVYSYSNPQITQLAKSTVALVRNEKFKKIDDILKMDFEKFDDRFSLCSSERFKAQPTTAFCSGFLISPTKIATAGHCIKNNDDCSNTSFVFDYAMTDESTANISFNKDQIYSCSKILGRKYEFGTDYAVIELERSVKGRQPLRLSKNKDLKSSDRVFVIGHPSGLPTKITDNAQVRSVKSYLGYFVVNTDTYAGNSGSAVFNEKTLEVEGILVRGDTDFTMNSKGCFNSQTFTESAGRGEDVTLISKIEEHYTEVKGPEEQTGIRYVWINTSGCVEFDGPTYNRVVDASFCADAPQLRYTWDENYTTCREYRGAYFMREVATSLCPEIPPLRYQWERAFTKCAEYRGSHFIRYTERHYCKRRR